MSINIEEVIFNLFSYALERVLITPLAVFLSTSFSVFGAVMSLHKVPTFLSRHYKIKIVIGSMISGVLLTLLRVFTEVDYSPAIVLATPLLSVLILRTASRDRFFSYLFIFIIMLCSNICVYTFSFSLFNFALRYEITLGTTEYMFASLSITGIILFIYEIIIIFFAKPFIQRVRSLVQSSKRGILFFFFLLNIDIVMLLAVFFALPILESQIVPVFARNRLSFFQMIASALMLAGSYLVIYIQIKLEQNLELEKMYRKSSQKNAIVNYSYNAVTGELLEDYNIFKKQYQTTPSGSSNYYDTMEVAVIEAIHPDDRSMVLAIRENITEMRKAVGSSYSMRVRMSPTKCADIIVMPIITERRLRSIGKEYIWVDITITIAADQSTDDLILYITVNDIDDSVTYEDILKKTAQLDPLTGIYNRGEMEHRISRFLETPEAAGALIILDVDKFKYINDTYGHKTGDAVLKQLSSVIVSVFRSEDIVARLGGDEFCIFTKSMNNRKLLEQRIINLKKGMQKPFSTEAGKEFLVTISLGVALCPGDGKSFDDLYQQADAALYKSKKSGRNTWHFYEDIAG